MKMPIQVYEDALLNPTAAVALLDFFALAEVLIAPTADGRPLGFGQRTSTTLGSALL